MSECRPIYKKGSLLYATIVALACVMTASVSTFAWFQAEANVRISASNSSTTISVSNDLDFDISVSISYFNGNTAAGYTGTPSGLNTFANYLPVEENDPYHRLSLSGLYPGRKMTYMLTATADIAIGNLQLTMTSFTAGVSSRCYDVTESSTLDTPIVLASAIRIYTGLSSTTAVSIDSGNQFAYSGNHSYVLLNKSNVGSTAYLFYTVEFSTASDALYQEYSEATAENAIFEPPSGNGNRFFQQDGKNGNSNCFEGLSFSIGELVVSSGAAIVS